MSLKALVENAVDLAWDVTGDLKTQMIFKSESQSEYDPKTSQVITKVVESKPFYGFLVVMNDKDLTSAGVSIVPDIVQAIVKKKDIPADYTKFDSICVNGVDHRITHYVDDGYTVKFTVSVR